ncbi:hypothetical protein DEW08_06680 [Azospirillum thermophilum]|uniref:Chemoreceptor zinc-binding domain-containing protein n=2 Tax=Azospirillum thermophilum TaxID=2202148 RepID=A0A2S2CUE5_9PROT|nr:hypothetical protein DEW08_06680 [Azospirillum thermophilum]
MLAAEGVGGIGTHLRLVIPEHGVRVDATVVAVSDGFQHARFDGEGLSTAEVNRIALRSTDRLVEATKNDHRVFVDRICAAAAGRAQIEPATLSTHHTCRLGTWYDNVSDLVMMELPAFKALAEPHREVHRVGREVLSALANGDGALAASKMSRLEESSRRVIGALDQLGRQYRQHAAASCHEPASLDGVPHSSSVQLGTRSVHG